MPFPTRLKCKISSKLSYPVGAELFCAELSDVPEAQDLEIDFDSKYEQMEDRGQPYEIFRVSYSGSETYDSGWRILVRPVPRLLKHSVKEALRADFFPLVRQWLKERAGLSGRHMFDSCAVVFDEKREPMLKWRQRDHRPP